MGTPNRYYSSTAVRTQLTAAVSASATALTVGSTSGFPSSTPFTLMLDAGTALEELVTVTGLSGTNLTVVRGVDGTSGAAHVVGCDVRHGASARDFREPQEHIAATANVHGVTGAVVGTTDTQALTNKTISGSSNTLTNVPKSAIPNDTVYTAATQTLTSKTISGASNTLTAIPKTAIPADTVYTGATQTLTGKTIDGGSNTLTNIAQTSVTDLPALSTTVSDHESRIDAIETKPQSVWGKATVTTNSSGYATVPHSAGFTPTVVVVTGSNPTVQNNALGVDTFTSTSFRVRAVNGSGNPVSTTIVVGYFLGE